MQPLALASHFNILPREVVLEHIIPRLSINESVNLRIVDKGFKQFMDAAGWGPRAPQEHPLFPNRTFLKYRSLQDYVTPIFIALTSGIGAGCAFAVGSLLAGLTHFSPHIYTPLSMRIFGESETGLKIAQWAVPLFGMLSTTVMTYLAYSLTSHSLLKGLAYGINSVAALYFIEAPPRARWLGLMSLRMAMQNLCTRNINFSQVQQKKLRDIDLQSDKVAGIALFVSYTALLILLNPILAFTTAALVAVNVKVICIRNKLSSSVNQG